MSLLRKQKKEVRKLNELLGAELGMTSSGEPRFAWFWSEDLIRPKRVYARTAEGVSPSYRTFAPDPEHPTILTTEPLYVTEKLCLNIVNSYILCVWIASPSFEEWRMLWGDTLEWPKGGEYFPVSGPRGEAKLDPEEMPTLDQTLQLIAWRKRDASHAAADLLEYYTGAEKRRTRDDKNRLRAELDNLLPAYDNVPGSNSYPFWFVGKTKADPRISKSELSIILPAKELHGNVNANS